MGDQSGEMAVPQGGGARTGDAVAARVLGLLKARRAVPGERLGDERQLAAELGVSRAGLRDALLLLRAAGVLELRAGSKGGVFYRPQPVRALAGVLESHAGLLGLTADQVKEAWVEVEAVLASLAAWRADEGQKEAVLRAAGRGALRPGRPGHTRQSDEFHEAVAAAARSPVLALVSDALGELDARAGAARRRQSTDVSVVYSHAHIADAIRAGDDREAARRIRFHLGETRKREEQ
ncbi:MAG: FadR family transcriptional regulator [Gaiellales bacterium]|nr:FadR family transcriptional regulator [Gaiellales bacterium]